MSRAKVRLARQVGVALTPKAARHLERRPYPPGVHGSRQRRGPSDYKIQLLEKQRLRYQYDIRERQMRKAFEDALRRPGLTGEVLLSMLEQRLDAVVVRSGLARTIYQARQFVSHGHVEIDGQRVDRRGARVTPGQTVKVRKSARALERLVPGELNAIPPLYLEVDVEAQTVKLLSIPRREQIPVICDEQLVVEFYSR